MKVYALTYLNPSWTVDDVERIVHYVYDDLGISFALSYPYILPTAALLRWVGTAKYLR